MKRIVIAGPGRSGTTVLVQLLDAVGMETTVGSGNYFSRANAGHEGDLSDPMAPMVVKGPHLTRELPDLLRAGTVLAENIRVVLIPFRDLEQAAASRVANSLRERRSVGAKGGLVGTRRPSRQADVLASELSQLLLSLENHDIAYSLLSYPRFATDFDYLWSKAAPYLPVDEADLKEAFANIISPSLRGHDYTPATWRTDVAMVVNDLYSTLRYGRRQRTNAHRKIS